MRRDISRTSPLDVRSLSRLFTNKLATDGLRLSHKKPGSPGFFTDHILRMFDFYQIFIVMCAFASDEFGSDAGCHDVGFTDLFVHESYRDCHTL